MEITIFPNAMHTAIPKDTSSICHTGSVPCVPWVNTRP
jgi:hypothetical protein